MIYNVTIFEKKNFSVTRGQRSIFTPPLSKPHHMTMSTQDFLTRIKPLYQVQHVSLVNWNIPMGLIARDRNNTSNI